jgi:hypothetical protein
MLRAAKPLMLAKFASINPFALLRTNVSCPDPIRVSLINSEMESMVMTFRDPAASLM